MTTITWPSDTKTTIDSIRAVIGRNITVMITVTGIGCPICSQNPVTLLSVNPFCSGCGGTYWIDSLSGWIVNAHVRWFGAEQPLWQTGGKIREGDCIATITYSGTYLDLLSRADYFIVDDKELYMKKYILRGVPNPNRIRITLLEDPDNSRG